MRILYLCLERIVPGGAAATHVGEICEGLRARGIEVALAAETGATRERGVARLARYARLLGRAGVALHRVDAVYVRSHFAALPLAALARLLGRPVIHEVNGPYGDAFVTHPRFRRAARTLSAIQRWQYRHAAHLIAVTEGLGAWARREAGHGRVTVIGNAANTALFRPEGEVTRRERPYVLFFGGLTRWHGVATMLAAVRNDRWPPGVDLMVVGPVVDPSLGPELDAAPAKVVRLGAVPQAELPALIRGAIATLVPISDPAGRSATGVLPLKLFEGLACGVPAIVTDLPGQAELVRSGGCGIVVPVDDPKALAVAVSRLASAPDEVRTMGAAGARLVAEHHSWSAAAARTEQILRAVTQR